MVKLMLLKLLIFLHAVEIACKPMGGQAPRASHASIESIDVHSIPFSCARGTKVAYVDKTAYLTKFLTAESGKASSLSYRALCTRPRQFGISNTLQVAEALLTVGSLPDDVEDWREEIQKDVQALFGGLAVERMSKSGDLSAKHLLENATFVIDLSLNCMTGTELHGRVIEDLGSIAEQRFGKEAEAKVIASGQLSVALALVTLMNFVPKSVHIAILVDEYDACIMRDVKNNRWDAARCGISKLKDLLSVSKLPCMSCRIQHFVVMGVARFAFTSIFSGFDDFEDLTTNGLMSDMLGFRAEEIRKNFPLALQSFAQTRRMLVDDALEQLATSYGGYCFDGMTTCFSPGLVLSALASSSLTYRMVTSIFWLGIDGIASLGRLMHDECKGYRMSIQDVVALDIANVERQSERDVIALLMQVGLLSLQPHRAAPELDELASECPMSQSESSVSCEDSAQQTYRIKIPNDYARKTLRRTLEQGLRLTSKPDIFSIAENMERACKEYDYAAVSDLIIMLMQSVLCSLAAPGKGAKGHLEAPFDVAVWVLVFASIPHDFATVVVDRIDASDRASITVSFTQKSIVWMFEVGLNHEGRPNGIADDKVEQAIDSCIAKVLLCCSVVIHEIDPSSKHYADAAQLTCSCSWRRRVTSPQGEGSWEVLKTFGATS